MQDVALLEFESVVRPGASPWRRFLRDLLRRKVAVVALAYILLFYAVGAFAPLVAPYDPNAQNLSVESRLQGPSWEHLLGTDSLGRDILSRVVYAARTTLLFTVAVLVTGGLVLGLGLGLLAGYRGGWVDTLIMRVGEVLAGIPTLFLMIAIAAAFRTRIDDAAYWLRQNTFLGQDAKAFLDFVIIVGVTVPFAWVGTARIVRSQALAIREMEYVLAAEALGASVWRIVTRHILPGVLPLFLVGVSGGMAAIAGVEVSLSFLGLGVDPPTASFGTLIGDGAGVRTFQAYPHLLLSAAVPVVLFFFAWNLLGDALVDILEPRMQAR
ncbi:Glutathione transport system permease protein GsiD [bacterium HR29]|nr:Glutathione transport system permease protein GsiD [bacterium HR29]